MVSDPRDTSALTRAIEENDAELLLAMGRAGGGEERRDAELTWMIGGSPLAYHNAVMRADLEAGRVDAALEQARARTARRRARRLGSGPPGLRAARLPRDLRRPRL